jgi:multiple sugar transport system ATP-binding protein
MAGVSLKTVSKTFGNQLVLKNINLEVQPGEFMVIVGPSGCGKSTLLRIIAGLETPSSGDVFIDKKPVNGVDPSKRNVAMVFQNYALYPTMTVFENLAFSQHIRKKDKLDIRKRVMESAEILQITDLLERKPKELSGGQRQRVALGRALVRHPKVFLFDEPLSNLDAKLRQEMRLEIKKLHNHLNTTMIYVTHDQTEAMTMADRICIMDKGEIQQIDTPENLYNKPNNVFVAEFIGMPPINLLKGEITSENDEIYFECNSLKINLKKIKNADSIRNTQKIILGIRPENLHDNYFAEIKDPENTISCLVNLVENLGSLAIIHSQCGNNPISALLKTNQSFRTGSEIELIMDVNALHFFDWDTYSRL